ncbi:MAG: hypothetical protein LBT55_08010 [Clostridiaceae bacterium]|jgi:hypothetical protein|nr:hypothetical protein [Clostridiaceae bacterium]
MWSCIVSIDKELQAEFGYIVSKIREIKNLSYAVEDGGGRYFIYLAALCEYGADIEEKLRGILTGLYLDKFKLKYFLDGIKYRKLDYSAVTLISALVYFDREFEEAVCRRALSEVSDYSVDGIFEFRLKQLRGNWEELAELCNNLVTVSGGGADDVFGMAAFMASSSPSATRLTVKRDADGRVALFKGRSKMEIEDVFGADGSAFADSLILNTNGLKTDGHNRRNADARNFCNADESNVDDFNLHGLTHLHEKKENFKAAREVNSGNFNIARGGNSAQGLGASYFNSVHEFNLLHCIIREHPREVRFERSAVSREFHESLKHITQAEPMEEIFPI